MASKKPTGTPNAAKTPAGQAHETKHSVARNKKTVTRIVEGVDEIAQKVATELRKASSSRKTAWVDEGHTILTITIGEEKVHFCIEDDEQLDDGITLRGCVNLVDHGHPDAGFTECDAESAERKLAHVEASIRVARTLTRCGFQIFTSSLDGVAEFNFVLPLMMEYKEGQETSDEEIAKAAKKIAETFARIGAPITYGEDDSEG